MKCPECESDQSDKANFCNECGCSLPVGRSKQEMTSPRAGAFRGKSAHDPQVSQGETVCAVDQSPCLVDTVIRAGACLSKTMDLDHFLEVVTAELVKSMAVEAAGILLYDDRVNDFYWRAVHDRKRVLAGDGSDRHFGVDRSAIDEAFLTGEPVLVGNGASISPSETDREADSEGLIQNALVVPLNTREKTTGVLLLANKKTRRFKDRDIRVSVSLAGVVAMAAENADFFEELLDSYKKVVGLERIKSKILNRLSHELNTPLAIMKASLRTMESKLGKRGIGGFEAAFERLNRQVQSLGRLELQVESIMNRGYAEEREIIAGLLESAASLIEIQAEQTPEIKSVASLVLSTLEEAFPAHHEQWKRIGIKEFVQSVLEHARGEAAEQGRRLTLEFDLDNGSEALIPDLVLHATIEGLVRNAVEATPDNGFVSVRGSRNGDFYVLTVEDSGFGIPEEDFGLVLDGFYQVQETEFYTSGRPYSFDAGGKGMDLFRIKMFSRIYGFGLYFRSRRCTHLIESLQECPGSFERCPPCNSLKDCIESGGTAFEVELPVAGKRTGNTAGV